MFKKLKPVIKKEFRQISRDRRILAVLLFVPTFLLIMFGYALNFDVKHISLAIYDEDRTSDSRNLIEQFIHSEYFELNYYLNNQKEVDKLLDNEKVKLAIIIPNNFSKKLQRGESAEIQIIIDGANANTASIISGYVNSIVQNYSLKIISEIFQHSKILHLNLPLEPRPRLWYNPELVSAKFLVPGLIAFILMITTVISTSLSIVREKERGTIEQIIVSPVQPIQLIIGKTLPYMLLALVSAYLILMVGYLLFDIEVKGSQFLLFLVTLIYLLAGLGMGIFISTVSDSQQVAFQISALLTILPTFILSGFVFPIRNMPLFIQMVTYIIPARYFLVAIRGIILKGSGLGAFWKEIVFLVIFNILIFGLSWLRMRKIKI